MTLIQTRGAFKSFANTLLRKEGRVAAEARLPEGLSLTFVRVPDGCRKQWKLVLLREDFYPTADEVEEFVRESFLKNWSHLFLPDIFPQKKTPKPIKSIK